MSFEEVINNTNDKEEEYIIKMPALDEEPHPDGIGCFCYEKMKLYKNKIAQVCTETGKKESNLQFLQKAIRTAIKMEEKGVTSDDIISICTHSHLNHMVPAIAAQFLLCKVASFDPNLSQNDTNLLMVQVKPKLIFVSSNSIGLIEKAIEHANCETEIIIFDGSSKYSTFDDYLRESSKENHFKPKPCKSLNDTAYIFFSSGTTGFPKGICVTHYELLAQCKNENYRNATKGNMLAFSSPYWISATTFLLLSMEMGATRIVTPRFNPEKFWSLINQFKVHFVFMAGTQIYEALNVKPKNPDISSLRFLFSGGTPLSKEQVLYIRSELPYATVFIGYGQTEACGLTFTDPLSSKELLDEKAGSCGTTIKGVTYKVVDIDTGEIVGPNKLGELWVKTKASMNGYHNHLASDRWDKDGFMSTGDLVYYDHDRYFYVVDRTKEMFKYKSWHVQPNVVESVIVQHPAVLKAVVIGIPHPTDCEHPMAIVTLKNDYRNVTADEIKKFANDRLHDTQQLRAGLKIVETIPLTPTGKINRRILKELILNNRL